MPDSWKPNLVQIFFFVGRLTGTAPWMLRFIEKTKRGRVGKTIWRCLYCSSSLILLLSQKNFQIDVISQGFARLINNVHCLRGSPIWSYKLEKPVSLYRSSPSTECLVNLGCLWSPAYITQDVIGVACDNLAKTDQMASLKSSISREEIDFYSDFLDLSIIDIVSFHKTDAIRLLVYTNSLTRSSGGSPTEMKLAHRKAQVDAAPGDGVAFVLLTGCAAAAAVVAPAAIPDVET